MPSDVRWNFGFGLLTRGESERHGAFLDDEPCTSYFVRWTFNLGVVGRGRFFSFWTWHTLASRNAALSQRNVGAQMVAGGARSRHTTSKSACTCFSVLTLARGQALVGSRPETFTHLNRSSCSACVTGMQAARGGPDFWPSKSATSPT